MKTGRESTAMTILFFYALLAISLLFSYQGNFDRLAVGFGQLVQMSEVNRFDADFQPVDNIGRNAGQLFDLRQRQMGADAGIAQLAGNAVSDFDDFVVFGCHYVQLPHVLLKQNRPQNESGGVDNCNQTACLFDCKAAYIAPSSTKEVSLFWFWLRSCHTPPSV